MSGVAKLLAKQTSTRGSAPHETFRPWLAFETTTMCEDR